MSNLDKAIEVIAEARRTAPRVRDMQDHVSPHIAQALADAGLLAPEPQIIRTRRQLAALDPDTMLADGEGICQTWNGWMDWANLTDEFFPLVVIAPGEQVSAASEALEEENE